MLTRASLENLVEISRHQRFGPTLRALDICIDHLTDEPDTTIVTQYPGGAGVLDQMFERRSTGDGTPEDESHTPVAGSQDAGDQVIVNRSAYERRIGAAKVHDKVRAWHCLSHPGILGVLEHRDHRD